MKGLLSIKVGRLSYLKASNCTNTFLLKHSILTQFPTTTRLNSNPFHTTSRFQSGELFFPVSSFHFLTWTWTPLQWPALLPSISSSLLPSFSPCSNSVNALYSKRRFEDQLQYSHLNFFKTSSILDSTSPPPTTSTPPKSKLDGSYHWDLERGISVLTVPLIVLPFFIGTGHSILDLGLGKPYLV